MAPKPAQPRSSTAPSSRAVGLRPRAAQASISSGGSRSSPASRSRILASDAWRTAGGPSRNAALARCSASSASSRGASFSSRGQASSAFRP
ncbi:hypothetical protein CKO45_03025 [Paracraurococcus ruber]|uniref:Uncharacterized protein n=1 Tax=Paracraurococcus ruber TaxID=77675 RepID=A0ABS1CSN2_9PROT|nr:hypothetical protein [Paracraurococcus ruber]